MIAKVVKKEMIDKDITITSLAQATGYTRSHLSNVINGKVESEKVKKIIALALNKPFKELWISTDKVI